MDKANQPQPRAWGKLDRHAPSPQPRLTLLGHCIDVAAVFEALLALPVLRQRLEKLAKRPLDAIDMARLAVLAFLHDIGKAGAGFFSKGLEAEKRLPPNQCGHTHCVAPLFHGDSIYDAHREALGLFDILQWAENEFASAELWLAAISHHGQPITLKSLESTGADYKRTWTSTVAGYQALDGLRELGSAARKLWPQAWSPSTRSYSPGLVHAFAGLVSLADWIGSNTERENFFPYDLEPFQDETRWPVARQRATHALRAVGLDLSESQAALRRQAFSFQQLFEDHPPRPLQVEAATALDQHLVILEAETGSGKTEAALWRFKALFERGLVDSLCFLLPTKVAATGIYQRLQHFFEIAFPDAALRPPLVLAVPSDLQANGVRGERLPDAFQVLWPDDHDMPEARFWAAENSKRYFAGGLVAGTIDQFLLSTLRTGHAHLRAALTLRSLVVVDEVHASDAYMDKILRQALARHAQAGGHAMLLSATLTRHAREQLLISGGVQPATPSHAAEDDSYPSFTHAGETMPVGASGRRKEVHVETLAAMREPAAIAKRAMKAIEAGQRVLIIRNTVAQAIATQAALEEQLGLDHPALFRICGVVALHHGRYALPDRRALDLKVGEIFGKGAAENTAPAVLVGTQTLEISVDCDCDLLITDIAPLDVLLQRIGRLHRHEARDPHRQGIPPHCIVLVPSQRDLAPLMQPGAARGLGIGNNTAYENLLMIEAAWRAAESHRPWRLPEDNRRLVEMGCDPARLKSLADELGNDWPSHWERVIGNDSAKRGQALPVLVDWQAPWDSLSRGELEIHARTRLGLDGLRLVLREPATSPFGHSLEEIPLPAWMCPKEFKSDAFEEQWETPDGLHLKLADHEFVYGRWGLRKLDAR